MTRNLPHHKNSYYPEPQVRLHISIFQTPSQEQLL